MTPYSQRLESPGIPGRFIALPWPWRDLPQAPQGVCGGQAYRPGGNPEHGLPAPGCRLENAPLDNNSLEQALKLIIRGRRNALFFKTPAGAVIADVITAVVATAYQAGINVFDDLVVLQRHAERVKDQPQRWQPWNYQATLGVAKKAA